MKTKLIEDLNDIFEEKWFKNLISEIGKNAEMTSEVSQIIGEAYIYAFSMQSCDGIQEYLTELLDKFENKNNSKNDIRSKMLLANIARKLNISEAESETSELVKITFLENYCKKGFVMHSFSEENLDNLMNNGFQSSEERKRNNISSNEIIEIARIFENHGIIKACGTYPFYSGVGLYVEQDPRKVYEHATLTPEWFFEFTGSDHNGLDSRISTHPFITMNYNACRQNVEDLCSNAQLSEQEKKKVADFFERKWECYGKGEKYVAIIPKEIIGKDDYNNILQQSVNSTNSSLITSVIRDEFGIFKEHVGNKVDQAIRPEEFSIMKLPDSREIFEQRPYIREKREDLKPSELYLDQIKRYAEKSNFDMNYINELILKIRTYWQEKETKEKKGGFDDCIEDNEIKISCQQEAIREIKEEINGENIKEKDNGEK